MIHGHKPNGYFATADGEGHRIEGETRQCVHCQFVWEYKRPHLPGVQRLGASDTERGFCLLCGGFLCGRSSCQDEQRRLIELMHAEYNQTRSCVPWEEWNQRIRDRAAKYGRIAEDMTLTDTGLLVPRSAWTQPGERTGGQ